MTIEQVKQDLPNVRVKFGNKIYVASVLGRHNDFATVSPFRDIDGGKMPHSFYAGMRWEFSWQAIARAVEEGSTLVAD